MERASGIRRNPHLHGQLARRSLVSGKLIIQNTATLCPLVAIQPLYMHPYTVAKMVASLGHLYGRRIYLNMLAGGFKNDLAAIERFNPSR